MPAPPPLPFASPQAARVEFPPRGQGNPNERAPMSRWQEPEGLGDQWDYRSGGVLLGRLANGRELGLHDDRHLVTIAGSRAGKSQTVLIPNLLRYPGSAVVIDPKGELYEATAATRRAMGQRVFILNPFNVKDRNGVSLGTHSHNPLLELAKSENMGADAAQLADALIIAPEKGDSHWTDAGKNLVTGLTLHLLTLGDAMPSIPRLRSVLANEAALLGVFEDMAVNEAFDGVIQNVGRSMLGKYYPEGRDATPTPTTELRSIISTAAEQTRPLDDVRTALTNHDFDLVELTHEQPMTVYLVLPATRIATHHRWLRLFIYQVLARLETNPIPRNRLPLWLVLEEFAALGYLRNIEAAAGYMAGMGIKLWAVLQDLTQLKRHYAESWETFLGNAGLIQAFGVVDGTTTGYLSKLLGETLVEEDKSHFVSHTGRDHGDLGRQTNVRSVPLLAAAEIPLYFSRETGRQLLLVPGRRPGYMQRLPMRTE